MERRREIHILNGEISMVLATMRRTRRFEGSPRGGEQPLLRGFRILRERIGEESRLEDIDCVTFLKPFLDVIRSEEAPASVTSCALGCVQKIVDYGFLSRTTNNVNEGANGLVDAVTHCRFEAPDAVSEELVLMKIHLLVLSAMKSCRSVVFRESNVQRMVETCFRISRQSSLSELLRRSAERSLVQLIQVIFGSLRILGPEDKEEVGYSATLKSGEGCSSEAEVGLSSHPQRSCCSFECILSVFRFISSLLSSERMREDARRLGLVLATVALEQGGSAFTKYSELMEEISTVLCRELIISVSTENNLQLSLALRCIFALIAACGFHLHSEIQTLFRALFLPQLEPRHHHHSQVAALHALERKEIVLAALLEYLQEPQFLIDLFVNFDCGMVAENLVELLCGLLAKNCFHAGGSAVEVHRLSLKCLLHVLEGIGKVETNDEEKWKAMEPLVAQVRADKHLKSIVAAGVDRFNTAQNSGLEFLQTLKVLENPLDPLSVALFLKHAPNLSKVAIGAYLGEPTPFNLDVLHEFCALFDFKSHHLDTSLRMFLASFHLPGEAQQIARVLEAFAKEFFNQHPDGFKNPDVAYLAAYSLIVLNTDQFNRNVKHKMSREQFISNIQKSQETLSTEMLTALYDSIVNEELLVPSEFDRDLPLASWPKLMRIQPRITPSLLSFSSGCTIEKDGNAAKEEPSAGFVRSHRGLVQLYSSSPVFYQDSPIDAFGRDVFGMIWASSVTAFSAVFDQAGDSSLQKLALEAFDVFARACSRYEVTEAMDKLIISLCRFVDISGTSKDGAVLDLYRNRKAHLAMETVFSLVARHAKLMRDSWKNVLYLVVLFFRLKVLPASFLSFGDFLTRFVREAPPVSPSPASRSDFGSLLSAFSSFLSTDVNTEENEGAIAAARRECQSVVSKCQIEEVFQSSADLDIESLMYAVKATIVMSSSNPDSPSSAFALDLLSVLTLKNESRIFHLWGIVGDHLVSLIPSKQAAGVVDGLLPITSERAVITLLRVCVRLMHVPEMGARILQSLALLLEINEPAFVTVVGPICATLCFIIQSRWQHVRDWSVVYLLFQRCMIVAGTHAEIIKVIGSFVSQQHVTPNALPGLLNLLGSSFLGLVTGDVAHSSMLSSAKGRERGDIAKGGERKSKDITVGSGLMTAVADEVLKEAFDVLFSLYIMVNRKLHAAACLPDESTDSSAVAYWPSESQPQEAMWRESVNVFASLARDRRPWVCQRAFSDLHRALLDPHVIDLSVDGWRSAFDGVLVPLFLELPPNSPDEIVLKYSALLSKVFLKHLHLFSTLSDFTSFFATSPNSVLHLLKGLYDSHKKSEVLIEAITETVKNLLLVMNASSVFERGSDIWIMSWPIVDKFINGLQDLLFPLPVPAPETKEEVQTPEPVPEDKSAVVLDK